MIKIHLVDRDGSDHELGGDSSLRLMEVLREPDYGVEAICGGLCSCGTCHVYVDPAWLEQLPSMEPDEEELLDAFESRQDNSRLSCQLQLTDKLDGIKVTIAPEE